MIRLTTKSVQSRKTLFISTRMAFRLSVKLVELIKKKIRWILATFVFSKCSLQIYETEREDFFNKHSSVDVVVSEVCVPLVIFLQNYDHGISVRWLAWRC